MGVSTIASKPPPPYMGVSTIATKVPLHGCFNNSNQGPPYMGVLTIASNKVWHVLIIL